MLCVNILDNTFSYVCKYTYHFVAFSNIICTTVYYLVLYIRNNRTS